jgi:hypothetical protein
MGTIFIVIQQWKGKMDLFQACLAALLVLIATSKVFSAQYMLWLIPLLAYRTTGNRRLWISWGGIFLLTTLIYPIYFGIIPLVGDPSKTVGFMPVIVLRDGLFVLMMLAYLFNFRNLRERSDLTTSSPS